MWSPIELPGLLDSIRSSEAEMEPDVRRLWEMIRVEPARWQQHPWGDEGGGFWVVGLLGRQVLWYNDIEDGFNVSPDELQIHAGIVVGQYQHLTRCYSQWHHLKDSLK